MKKYFIFLFVVSLGAYGQNASPSFAESAKAGLFGSEVVPSSIEECAKKCKPAEASFAKRYLSIVVPLQKDSSKFAEATKQIAKLLEEVSAYYEKNKDVSNHLLSVQNSLDYSYITKMVDGADSELSKRIFVSAEKLPEKYSQNARALFLRAYSFVLQKRDTLDIIRAYHACLKQDPKEALCKRGYDEQVKVFMQPGCDAKSLGPIEFSLVTNIKPSESEANMKFEKETYYFLGKPWLTESDIEFVFANSDKTGPTGREFTLNFTPAGAKKLTEMTAAGRGKKIGVVVNGKLVSVPNINEKIEGSSVSISAGMGPDEQKIFEKICPNPKSPELPKDLKL